MTMVLVVDDEYLVSDLLSFALEDAGYFVARAHNGRAALDVLKTQAVDLIITDFMMPVMNGLELAAAVKADPALRHLPIILVSGAQASVARGYPSLFAAVFDKPFKVDALLDCVGKLAAPK